MELSNHQKGISLEESIKLFFKINILKILYIIPFRVLSECVKKTQLDTISPYINIFGEIFAYICIIRKIIKEMNASEEFKLKIQYKPKLKEYLYVILVLIGYRFIFSNSLELVLAKIPVNQWIQDMEIEIINSPILVLITSTCVIAPIFEETIYRGIILEMLHRRYGMIKAIIVSSMLFAIMHLNIHQGVNAFFLGIILGFIYIKTKSLLLSIFLHFITNLYVALSIFIPYLDVSSSKFSIVGLGFGVIILILVYKIFNNIEVDLSRKFTFIRKVEGEKTM